MYTIIESEQFKNKVSRIWSEEERLRFFAYIASDPLVGDVIPHSDGLRKVRWHASGRGKRGGARIIYFNMLANGYIIMLDLYTKM